MQAFKLINAGFVDKVIVFDALPDRLMQGVRTRPVTGFPRSWAKWLAEIGSVRDIIKTETVLNADRSYTFKYTPIGKEPCFFVLEYTDLNADIEKWREISEYLRMNVGPEVRLKEKVENMALDLAPDPKAPLEVEPEELMEKAVIIVPHETSQPKQHESLVAHGETIMVEKAPPRKRGRPKKITLGV